MSTADTTPKPWWKRAWQRWLRIAAIIGDSQARVVLSLVYFIIILPFGLGVRFFAEPLGIKGRRQSAWSDFPERSQTPEAARRQA